MPLSLAASALQACTRTSLQSLKAHRFDAFYFFLSEVHDYVLHTQGDPPGIASGIDGQDKCPATAFCVTDLICGSDRFYLIFSYW